MFCGRQRRKIAAMKEVGTAEEGDVMDDRETLDEGEQTKQLVEGNPPPVGRHIATVAIAAIVGFAAGMGGTVLLTRGGDEVVATQAPNATTSSVPAAGDQRQQGPTEFAQCLRGQGLDFAGPPTGPSSVTLTKQYPPEAAAAAWHACRDTYVRTSGMPTEQSVRILAVPDCMAAQGWIIVAMSGPPADVAAYNAAMQKCSPSTPVGGPPVQVQLAACLRANGLDVPAPLTGPSSVTPTKQYPPEAAAAAWHACRDIFVRTSGMPTEQSVRILEVPDCMAAQGWIIVAMSGPPADVAAYNAAMQKCQPMAPATIGLAGQVPQSTRS